MSAHIPHAQGHGYYTITRFHTYTSVHPCPDVVLEIMREKALEGVRQDGMDAIKGFATIIAFNEV
jgi:hypothetical protein